MKEPCDDVIRYVPPEEYAEPEFTEEDRVFFAECSQQEVERAEKAEQRRESFRRYREECERKSIKEGKTK